MIQSCRWPACHQSAQSRDGPSPPPGALSFIRTAQPGHHQLLPFPRNFSSLLEGTAFLAILYSTWNLTLSSNSWQGHACRLLACRVGNSGRLQCRELQDAVRASEVGSSLFSPPFLEQLLTSWSWRHGLHLKGPLLSWSKISHTCNHSRIYGSTFLPKENLLILLSRRTSSFGFLCTWPSKFKQAVIKANWQI